MTRDLPRIYGRRFGPNFTHAGMDVDLPQVDHGGGRARGRERATRATKSRVVDLCPLQEFKSH